MDLFLFILSKSLGVLKSAGVKIVVAFSHYAASLQRSFSEGLFFSGLS